MKRSSFGQLRDILINEKESWDADIVRNIAMGKTCEVFLTGTRGIEKTSFLTWLIKTLLRRGYRFVFGCREFKGEWSEMLYTTLVPKRNTLR